MRREKNSDFEIQGEGAFVDVHRRSEKKKKTDVVGKEVSLLLLHRFEVKKKNEKKRVGIKIREKRRPGFPHNGIYIGKTERLQQPAV